MLPYIEIVSADRLSFVCHWEHDPNVVSVGAQNRLVELALRWRQDVDEGSVGSYTKQGKRLEKLLEDVERGQKVCWPELPLKLDGLTSFSIRVLDVLCTQVPYGTVVSYKELAALAGHPGAARGVGQIMGRLRWGLIYPAHRVIGAGGRIGGFGVCGEEMKRYLLSLEGVFLS